MIVWLEMSINGGMGKEDVVYIYIYTMEYYSAIRKNEIMPFAVAWMDLETVILSEVSQTEKDKYPVISLICGIYKKRYKWTYLQNRNRLTSRKKKLMVTKREVEWINWEIGIDRYTLVYIK